MTPSTAFLDLWERAAVDPELPLRLTSTRNFAERAARLGFRPSDLFYSCLTAQLEPEDKLSRSELFDVIAFSERTLNRWATPILGKD